MCIRLYYKKHSKKAACYSTLLLSKITRQATERRKPAPTWPDWDCFVAHVLSGLWEDPAQGTWTLSRGSGGGTGSNFVTPLQHQEGLLLRQEGKVYTKQTELLMATVVLNTAHTSDGCVGPDNCYIVRSNGL